MRTVGLTRIFNGQRYERYCQVVGYEEAQKKREELQKQGYKVRTTERRYTTKGGNLFVLWVMKNEKLH